MLMLAGGGEVRADIEHLRVQAELLGSVPSDSTRYRTFRPIDPRTLDGLWDAMAEVRAQEWRRSAATTGKATVVLDIDSSLHEIHSENKEETAATYKGGFGFHRASSGSGRHDEEGVRDDVTERQAHGSRPVRVRSGETPGSPVARLPTSEEIPPSKQSDEVSERGRATARSATSCPEQAGLGFGDGFVEGPAEPGQVHRTAGVCGPAAFGGDGDVLAAGVAALVSGFERPVVAGLGGRGSLRGADRRLASPARSTQACVPGPCRRRRVG
jgi:hypothetical protein